MLYAFAFETVGVVASDLYFLNPDPEPGQEGAEQGVRVEVRLFQRGSLPGSIYSARPIVADRPIWRADLFESVAKPGTLDRAHHHPRFSGWEPGGRTFDTGMSADPLGFVARRLSDLEALLVEAGVERDDVTPADAAELRAAVPEMVAAVERLLDRARAAGPSRAPDGPTPHGARVGWL